MNREIKFRGLMVDGAWKYGFYNQDDEDDLIAQWDDEFDRFREYAVISKTTGQFTGLTDKNGKEIYEGDLLKWESTFGNGICAVCWAPGHFYLEGYPFEDENVMIDQNWFKLVSEVIGNIHENKELLS